MNRSRKVEDQGAEGSFGGCETSVYIFFSSKHVDILAVKMKFSFWKSLGALWAGISVNPGSCFWESPVEVQTPLVEYIWMHIETTPSCAIEDDPGSIFMYGIVVFLVLVFLRCGKNFLRVLVDFFFLYRYDECGLRMKGSFCRVCPAGPEHRRRNVEHGWGAVQVIVCDGKVGSLLFQRLGVGVSDCGQHLFIFY